MKTLPAYPHDTEDLASCSHRGLGLSDIARLSCRYEHAGILQHRAVRNSSEGRKST